MCANYHFVRFDQLCTINTKFVWYIFGHNEISLLALAFINYILPLKYSVRDPTKSPLYIKLQWHNSSSICVSNNRFSAREISSNQVEQYPQIKYN